MRRARILVALEALVDALALPFFVLGLFVGFSWLGVFSLLAPWVHLAALVIFTAWFFAALREARERYQKPSASQAKRRLEAANHLAHRPLDVREDRPLDPAQTPLWQEHIARNDALLRGLRAPKWNLTFFARDPYALRYMLALLLMLGLALSWGEGRVRLQAALNPVIGGNWHPAPLTLNAWITPPDYTRLPPVMIATPAGLRNTKDTLEVPEGSTLSVHLKDKGDAPTLQVNGEATELTLDDHGDFATTQTLVSGDKIMLRRGWRTLGAWAIRVVPDAPPQIALSDKPAATERKSTALSYEASDDYGVQKVVARIEPTQSVPNIDVDPVEVPLAQNDAKQIKQESFVDLTASPWAGMPVRLQLAATDAAGHTSLSEPVTFTLPERVFLQPQARALNEERKKLLREPSEPVRHEAANLMAGLARQPLLYRGDPVVMMALRSGAVRLVLNEDKDNLRAVNGLLWQTAVRIEDGTVGLAQDALRQAQKELAAALDRNASDAEIQPLIDRVQQALSRYMQELAARMPPQPPVNAELQRLLGEQVNQLTPDDLQAMLEHMRDLSATGSREEARKQLAQLQSMMENLRTAPPELTAEQMKMLQDMAAVRQLAKEQQALLDQTFQASQKGEKELRNLKAPQQALLKRLREVMGKEGKAENLDEAEAAMLGATGALQQGSGQAALKRQGEAVAALQKGLQAMQEQMRGTMLALPRPGQGQPGEGRDPFGRKEGNGVGQGTMPIPETSGLQRARAILEELRRRAGEGSRSPVERGYIERLLERF